MGGLGGSFVHRIAMYMTVITLETIFTPQCLHFHSNYDLNCPRTLAFMYLSAGIVKSCGLLASTKISDM